MKPAALRRHGSYFLILLASISLSIFPVPECFDCEPNYAWGQSAWVASRNVHILEIWLVAVPLLAAVFGLRRAWLVPIGVVIADVATQHLAGVPWWDVRDNEGPIIALVDLPIGFSSLALGLLLHFLVRRFLSDQSMVTGAP